MKTHELRGSFFIMMATVFWSLSAVSAKYMFKSRPLAPLLIVQARMTIAALVLFVLLFAFSRHLLVIGRRHVPYFFVHGAFGMALVQLAYFTAVREGTVSSAIFLQYTAPLLAAVYYAVRHRRLPPAYVISSLLVAMCGSGLLLLGSGTIATTSLGLAAGLMSAVMMAFYAIYGAHGVKLYSSWTALFWGLLSGSVVLFFVQPPWVIRGMNLVSTDWLFLVFMALLGTLIPFGLFLYGLKQVPALQAILISMLEPVLASAFAALFIREYLTPIQIMGGALIVVAVAWVELKRAQESQIRLPQPNARTQTAHKNA